MGTISDVARAAARAREVGAISVVDAVHYALHGPIDVKAIGCDFLLCSAYKFFGPHVGVVYARYPVLDALRTLMLNTQEPEPPFKLETGTLNHEGIAGAAAAVEFIADFGRHHEALVADQLPGDLAGRRRAIVAGMLAGELHERPIARYLIDELSAIDGVTVYGPPAGHPRTSTVSFTLDGTSAADVCRTLGRAGPLPLGRGLLRLQAGGAARSARPRRPGARRPRPLQHDGRGRAARRRRRRARGIGARQPDMSGAGDERAIAGAPRRVRLCLLGFGNVARRLCEMLTARGNDLAERFGLEVVVTAVGTRSHGSVVAPAGLSPAEALRAAGLEPGDLETAPTAPAGWGFAEPARPGTELIAASGADVLVESTVQEAGGAATAIEHVEYALERDMHVLTVNKGPDRLGLPAPHRPRRSPRAPPSLRRRDDGRLPRLQPRGALPPGRARARHQRGAELDDQLPARRDGRRAAPSTRRSPGCRTEGFAEADPSHDIDGVDAASKTAALANVLMDARLTPADVPRESIRAVSAERVAAVRAAGRRLRVVCEATVVEGAERLPVLGAPAAPPAEPPAVSAAVRLVEVDADHPFFAVGGSMSTVIIRTDLMGEVQIVERDALLTQTAYAVYSDLLSLYAEL